MKYIKDAIIFLLLCLIFVMIIGLRLTTIRIETKTNKLYKYVVPRLIVEFNKANPKCDVNFWEVK